MSRVRPFASWRLALPILLLAPLAACRDELPTTPAGPQALAAVNPDLTDRYIVVFRPTVPDVDAMVEALTRAHGGTPGYRYYTVLKGFAATLPAAAIEGIRRNPNVAYVEPDGVATVVGPGSQTLTAQQWGLDRIDQQATRTRDNLYSWETDGAGVEVYILDTGLRYSHQEFVGRAFSFYDFYSNDPIAQECQGHGTHVAGTIGGTNVGVAKRVTLYSARVLGCSGSGSYTGIIKAIDSVTARKVAHPTIPMVGNMSLSGGRYEPLNTAVNNSVARGVVWAVAASNDNADACGYSPASAANALTTGATDSLDVRSYFSNYGSCVDLFAPGSAIWSSTKTSDASYESWSGTSMATPHVAGVAALYLSAWPTASAYEVNQAITTRATTGAVSGAGSGSPNRLLYSLITRTRVTEPPPPPTVVMHLGDLTGYPTPVRKGWTATVVAAVHDAGHSAVADAVVSFNLSDGANGTGSCTTDAQGLCSYTKANLKTNVGSVTFTVTGISKTGATYNAGANDVDTSVMVTK